MFPSIDHYGSAYDGYQYTIAGSSDGVNWTILFDATAVSPCNGNCVAGATGEPFTLSGYSGTPPTTVNNVLMAKPSPGLPAGCAAGVGMNGSFCIIGYIATFNFSTAYQYYAFGASTVAINAENADQELSAVGAIVPSRAGTFPPTSGALLNITSSDKTINLNIYDSQIHTGTVQVVPVGSGMSTCNTNDAAYPTDAYVLQGGSPTGCDPGEAFETSQGTGSTAIGGFTITTTYGPTPNCTSEGVTKICAGPNTGFLTVTNTGGSFTGTITLTGTAVANSTESTCVAGGSLTDTFNGTLLKDTSATLALASDTSSCGGFNAPLHGTLTAGTTTIYAFGREIYQITPFNSAPGDTLSVLPVPVPAGAQAGRRYGNVNNGAGEAITFPSSQSFNSGTNFPGQNCIAWDDFSATGNPVCVELQLACTSKLSDCEAFFYQTEVFFTRDHNSLGPVGGAAFLGQHIVNCTSSFNPNLDIFLAYLPQNPDPVKGSGGGTSCFATTYNSAATAVLVGQTQTEVVFVGFQTPVANGVLNNAKAGSTVPLIWQTLTPSPATLSPISHCARTRQAHFVLHLGTSSHTPRFPAKTLRAKFDRLPQKGLLP